MALPADTDGEVITEIQIFFYLRKIHFMVIYPSTSGAALLKKNSDKPVLFENCFQKISWCGVLKRFYQLTTKMTLLADADGVNGAVSGC